MTLLGQAVQAALLALHEAFNMAWEILWPLTLGFGLSAIVQTVVSHRQMAKTLGDDSPRTLALAALLGAASSSCSYAAVALARAIFRKGASFTAAMVFELASTNLVLELGIVLIVLLGWPFAAATWLGGIVMVVLLAIIFRLTLSPQLVALAREHAERGAVGRMEGHAEMEMSVTEGPSWQRLFSEQALTAISHYYVMDWASVWLDVVGGLLIAGALGLTPTSRDVGAITRGLRLDYTSVLNVVFIVASALMVWRFLRTGGPEMLRRMNTPSEAPGDDGSDGDAAGAYTCPMHPDVRRAKRGTCLRCGMDLVPAGEATPAAVGAGDAAAPRGE